GSTTASDELMVRYQPGADRVEMRDLAGVRRSGPMLLSRAEIVVPRPGVDRRTAIRDLRGLGGVDRVEPVRALRLHVDPPDDSLFGAQWALENHGQSITGVPPGTPGASIAALTGWNVARESPDVLTAVIDNGIQTSHPDLSAQIWS